jgi:hypothetical protein
MNENLLACLIWAACGLLLAGIGVRAFFAEKPVGFFANAEPPEVADVKKYNRATGWLIIALGAVVILLGLPLLIPGGEWWMLLCIPVLMVSVIAAMVVYTLGIERKYRAK